MNKKLAYSTLMDLLEGQDTNEIVTLLCNFYSTYDLEQLIIFLKEELES